MATVVHLLDTTLIRVGNDEYAANNKSYGLTTLQDRHAKINGDEVRFIFTGKSGKTWKLALKDKRIAKTVKAAQDLPGQRLFQYLDDDGAPREVTSSDVNAYLREITGRDVTAKDFRTWGGTMAAAVSLRSMGVASSKREADRNIIAALDIVRERLGNTRAVCRKYYVHPALIEAYHMGRVVPLPPVNGKAYVRKHRESALRRDEVAVLQFLQDELD